MQTLPDLEFEQRLKLCYEFWDQKGRKTNRKQKQAKYQEKLDCLITRKKMLFN